MRKYNNSFKKVIALMLSLLLITISLPLSSFAEGEDIKTITLNNDIEKPVITLNGDLEVAIFEFQSYNELGASAIDTKDGDLTERIVTVYKSNDGTVLANGSNGIDTSIVGNSYKVEYKVSDQAGNEATIERTIRIVEDTQAPIITRKGDFMLEIVSGSTYIDKGAIAIDQVNYDISDRIEVGYRLLTDIEVKTDISEITSLPVGTMCQIIYQVTDAAGNPAEAVFRMITMVAGEAPVITVYGNPIVTIFRGDAYKEDGAKAIDSKDGNVDVVITIQNSHGEIVTKIDTSKTGTYTCFYDAKDLENNQAVQKQRIVKVVEPSALEIKYINDSDVYIKTGSAPFSVGTGSVPGLDFSDSDEYVRTLDRVSYPIAYSVTNESNMAKNLKIVGSITDSNSEVEVAKWDEKLSLIPNLTISADGQTFTYDLGLVDGGQAFDFTANAIVQGDAKNGDVFSTQFRMTADNANESTTTIHSSTVSAAPRVDLILKKGRDDVEKNEAGKFGVTMTYAIGLSIKDGMGSEQIANPVKFVADIENFGVENAVLRKHNGFGINGEGYRIDSLPLGKLDTNEPLKSVYNSGSVEAVQDNPGKNIEVLIKDMDVISGHFPNKNYNDSTISIEENYVFAGYLRIWVAYDDLLIGNNPVTLTYKELSVQGISGLDNYLDENEPTENNKHSHDVIKRETGDAGFGYRIDYAESVFTNKILDTMTSSTSGDGTVVAGQKFAANSYLSNSKFVDLTETVLMTKFDPTVMSLVDFDENTPGDQVYRTYGALDDNYVVEFGIGNFSDYDDIRTTSEPENGIWYSSFEEAVNANLGEVSMVKVRAINGEVLKNNEYFSLNLSLQAKHNTTGTLLPVFAAVQANEVNSGSWDLGHYAPEINGDVTHGQRLMLTEVLARIEKNTKTPDLRAVTLEDGTESVIEYVLKPSLTADSRLSNPSVSENIRIIDTLPKGMSFVNGSASITPESVELQSDETTVVTWNLGKNINLDVEPIEYSVEIGFDISTNTELVNTVVIETLADLSPEEIRTDRHALMVVNNQSWGIKENVVTPLVEVDDPIIYEILYAQFKNRDMEEFELISILPHNGDVSPQTNDTSFYGTYTLSDVIVGNGESVFATLDDPSTIEMDPKKNVSSWKNYSDIVADGETEKITALKFKSPVFKSGEATRKIKIVIQPDGNAENNSYATFTTGRTDAIDLPVQSKEVLARVVASSIGNTVWMDNNQNGDIDAGEMRLEKIRVQLFKDGIKIEEQETDAQGQYLFDTLHSGTYEVKVERNSLPINVKQVYDPDNILDDKTMISLGVNSKHITADFGYATNVIPDIKGSIGDYIFNDINQDGMQNVGDVGLPSIKVTLTKEDDNSFNQSVLTDLNGHYVFTDLEMATYTVTVDATTIPANMILNVDPDGGVLTGTYTIEISSTGISNNMDVDFGYYETVNNGSIGDFVFEDLNKNGQYDLTDTAIMNAKLILTKPDKTKVETTTDENGKYKFNNLEKGVYKISIIGSSVDMNMKLTIDPDDRVDGSHNVALNENQVVETVDFGFQRITKPATIDPTTPKKPKDDSSSETRPEDKPQTEETTVEVVQVMKGRLVVHYLDRFTNKPLTNELRTEDEIGHEYSTEEKSFEGYEFVEVTDNKSGLYTEEDTVVIYYYEEIFLLDEDETPFGQTSLPKTGEKSDLPWMITGALFILLGVIGVFKRKIDMKCEKN